MAHTGGDSFVKDSVITDDDEPMIVESLLSTITHRSSPTIIVSSSSVITGS
ncbi:unnamed protein product, partial [Rotaria sp. Silwood2]